jgi:hypothetical protein
MNKRGISLKQIIVFIVAALLISIFLSLFLSSGSISGLLISASYLLIPTTIMMLLYYSLNKFANLKILNIIVIIFSTVSLFLVGYILNSFGTIIITSSYILFGLILLVSAFMLYSGRINHVLKKSYSLLIVGVIIIALTYPYTFMLCKISGKECGLGYLGLLVVFALAGALVLVVGVIGILIGFFHKNQTEEINKMIS